MDGVVPVGGSSSLSPVGLFLSVEEERRVLCACRLIGVQRINFLINTLIIGSYTKSAALHQTNAGSIRGLTAGSHRVSAGGDVPRSASAERRLPAAFRRPGSPAAEALPGTGLPRRQEPAQTSVPPRLPRPRTPGLPPLPTAQEVPFPRGRKSPKRGVLGWSSAERGESNWV